MELLHLVNVLEGAWDDGYMRIPALSISEVVLMDDHDFSPYSQLAIGCWRLAFSQTLNRQDTKFAEVKLSVRDVSLLIFNS
jgi:hypothetical protein